jgi:demethylmenaquinone methyltransferase/2-methoxy-6-polyprenyl-1,4-benzoquinol methylase
LIDFPKKQDIDLRPEFLSVPKSRVNYELEADAGMSRKSLERIQRIQALQSDPGRLSRASRNCQVSCLLLVLMPFFSLFLHYVFLSQSDTDERFLQDNFGSGEMFDIVADNYDLTNRILAMRMDLSWRRELVSRIKQRVPSTGSKILDLATGTADVALLLAEAIPKANITGVDPSVKMLQVAVTKINAYFRRYSPRIELEYGDARNLSITSQSIDGATMSFGIRNVPSVDRKKALCEIHRVLKPNAVFGILEFSEPDETAGILGYLCSIFVKFIVPFVGGIVTGHPKAYQYLQQSIDEFPAPNDFVSMMEGLNCPVYVHGNEIDVFVGYFKLDELVHLNFGSVQLYVATALSRKLST